MKLSAKISGVILITALIGTILTSILASIFVRSAIADMISRQRLEMARQTMDKIDRILFERLIEIQQIGQMGNLAKAFSIADGTAHRDLQKKISDLTMITGPWDMLNIVDRRGTIVLSTGKRNEDQRIGQSPSELKALKEALKGRVHYSDFFMSQETGRPGILFAAPIMDERAANKTVLGAVFGYFSWQAILEIFDDLESHAVLLTRDGLIIGHNKRYESMEDLYSKIGDVRQLVQNYQSDSFKSVSLAPEQSFLPCNTFASIVSELGFSSYHGNGWNLVLEVPAAVAFASSKTIVIKVVLVFAFATGFMIGVVLLLMRLLVVRPIASITKVTQEIAEGNLSKEIRMQSHDEIGQLALSFNTMTAKLRHLHEGLERRVRERTAELEEAMQNLNAAQKRLLQSEKMSAVGQLAAGVAHEINNPLGIIMGFAQGICKRIGPGDPLELPAKSIEREAVRCKNLVQDLLTFSRADRADRVPIDVVQTIDGALSLIQAKGKVNSVDIQKNIAEDIPHILASQNQIQQVIINLANNAMDAMPKGGVLRITAELAKGSPRSWVCIRIMDTGEGIPKEVQSKIFEPFFTTKPVGKGTGLGLSLVYEIVKRYSGTIEFDSRPGFTEFCVKFPCA